MDSFAYRMSDNDDRRKPLGISDIYDLIALEAEKGHDLSVHNTFEIALTNGHTGDDDDDDNNMLTERQPSDKQTETNTDSMRPLDYANTDELENIYANTQIYANANMLGANDYANANCTMPVGRKPALPPKPSSQANTMKRNRSTNARQTTQMVTGQPTLSLPNSEYSAQKDPAEMSMKERLALFEQSTRTIAIPPKIQPPVVIPPKIQPPSAPMTLPKKQSQNMVRKTESAAIIHATISNEISKMVRTMPKPTMANGSPKFPMAHPKTPPPPVPTKKKPLPAAKVQPNSFELISAVNGNRSRHQTQPNAIECHAEETKLICDQNTITTMPPSAKSDRPQKPFDARNGTEQPDMSSQLLAEEKHKEEDRWDKFIECLLFFCCVG